MAYKVVLTRAARRNLSKLPHHILERVDDVILILSKNPKPQYVKKLKGKKEVFRLRVGDYRVLYKVENRRLLVLTISIGHRKDIYR